MAVSVWDGKKKKKKKLRIRTICHSSLCKLTQTRTRLIKRDACNIIITSRISYPLTMTILSGLALLVVVQFFYLSLSKSILSPPASSLTLPDKTNINLGRQCQFSNIICESTKNCHHRGLSSGAVIMNIVADLCPHGMLPLAYGIATGPTGVVPAVVLLLIFGSMSAYSMSSIASLAEKTKSANIGELWGKLIGKRSKWVADVAVFLLCFGCNVFYSAFIGDIFASIASAVGLTGFLAKRWVLLSVITSCVLLPLCSLEDISALQFSSFLGVAGIATTFLFHALRYFDGKYAPLSAIVQKMAPHLRPNFPVKKISLWSFNSGSLVLANMFCVAFLAHYNAIGYYHELEGRTQRKYSIAVAAGFGTASLIFAGMMFMGYSLFGLSSQPLILNNFHRTDDFLATIARLGIGLAITFAYPLMFSGLKSSMFNLLFVKSNAEPPRGTAEDEASQLVRLSTSKATEFGIHASRVMTYASSGAVLLSKKPELVALPIASAFVGGILRRGDEGGRSDVAKTSEAVANVYNTVTPAQASTIKKIAIELVLGIITSIAFRCGEEDVSGVLGVVGSILGCSVAYVLPGIFFLQYARQAKMNGEKVSGVELVINHALIGLGLVFGVLGVWITLVQGAHH